VPKAPFSQAAIPSFDAAPSTILIAGPVEFFVEEAAAQATERLSADGTEVLKFSDEAPAEAISDALLNRSLFSPRRLVVFDVSRLLGSDSPASLLEEALEAWARGNSAAKREAFRKTHALLSALDLGPGDPDEVAQAAAKKVRRRDDASTLAEILRELPEEKGGPAVLREALRLTIGRPNEGTVALLTAVAPPTGVDLVAEIARTGLVLTAGTGEKAGEELARFANARAKEREVTLDPEAVARLLSRTDGKAQAFASELSKLLDWAGPGGRVRAADVVATVEDEASEDLYPFYDALGRRDAADALARLSRLFSGRVVRAADREIDTDDYWPVYFFGMLTGEIRRMLLVRACLERAGGFDASMSYRTFEARLLPALSEPVTAFGRSPFATAQGSVSGYAWYKAAQRASRYRVAELARALSRAAEVDVSLKSSTPPLDALTAYVARLVAGN
jgi:DNA polymerase III delta subunit